jgi:hypothetical protein
MNIASASKDLAVVQFQLLQRSILIVKAVENIFLPSCCSCGEDIKIELPIWFIFYTSSIELGLVRRIGTDCWFNLLITIQTENKRWPQQES